jgi:hypothetical protein
MKFISDKKQKMSYFELIFNQFIYFNISIVLSDVFI